MATAAWNENKVYRPITSKSEFLCNYSFRLAAQQDARLNEPAIRRMSVDLLQAHIDEGTLVDEQAAQRALATIRHLRALGVDPVG